MLYIVMTTPECNYCCSYCGGSLLGMPKTVSYDLQDLESLILKDDEAIVCFYGGEPLLELSTLKTMLQRLSAKHFVLQTNGSLLFSLENDVHKIDSILLSIDGIKTITDDYRQPGCYDSVMSALSWLKTQHYQGEIIARMTVSKNTDISRDVLHLLTCFPLVHWQLDAVWSPLWGLDEFKTWAETCYKPGLQRLINWFNEEIQKGNTAGIIPFRGIITRMFQSSESLCFPPCGAGSTACAITTDGIIMACPICPDFEWNNLGSLSKGYHTVNVQQPCTECSAYKICGGRCLFAYKERLWGQEGFDYLCGLTKYLIGLLEENRELYKQHIDTIQYPPYNNSTEIIP